MQKNTFKYTSIYTEHTTTYAHTHIPVYTILPETEYGFHAKKGSGKPHTLQANCTTQNQKTKQLKTEEGIATRCLMTHKKKSFRVQNQTVLNQIKHF